MPSERYNLDPLSVQSFIQNIFQITLEICCDVEGVQIKEILPHSEWVIKLIKKIFWTILMMLLRGEVWKPSGYNRRPAGISQVKPHDSSGLIKFQ